MDRNQAKTFRKDAALETWLQAGRVCLAWVIVAGLVTLAGLALQYISTHGWALGWMLGALGVLHALLALSLERGLEFIASSRKWRYRLVFFLSVGLSAIYSFAWFSFFWPARHLSAALPSLLACLAAAVLGVLVGCLALTAWQEGLWENNSPPGDLVCAEVYQWHKEQIGVPASDPWAKRTFDICLASFGLLLSAPVWLLSICLIWLEDPGPIFFVKNSVGKGGRNFYQFKLRTMVRSAEDRTGPILAQRNDARILFFGRFLRKTALDELPQLLNILLGQMSFVGPRPQRTVLVHDYLQRMPEYAERHRVRPGLAGLAQVAGDYYLTPRQKLRFDRLYIRYVDLGFDIKLFLLACLITFWLRWQKDWNGRLPRWLLRLGTR